ncbi:hypothetical protein MAR_003717, partial [Mya arenaria]
IPCRRKEQIIGVGKSDQFPARLVDDIENEQSSETPNEETIKKGTEADDGFRKRKRVRSEHSSNYPIQSRHGDRWHALIVILLIHSTLSPASGQVIDRKTGIVNNVTGCLVEVDVKSEVNLRWTTLETNPLMDAIIDGKLIANYDLRHLTVNTTNMNSSETSPHKANLEIMIFVILLQLVSMVMAILPERMIDVYQTDQLMLLQLVSMANAILPERMIDIYQTDQLMLLQLVSMANAILPERMIDIYQTDQLMLLQLVSMAMAILPERMIDVYQMDQLMLLQLVSMAMAILPERMIDVYQTDQLMLLQLVSMAMAILPERMIDVYQMEQLMVDYNYRYSIYINRNLKKYMRCP